MVDDIILKGSKMIGGWRAPENLYRGLKTSIHDDATAKKVGMRGGTIPGTIHLSMFSPLGQKLFGDRFFETGTISMYYTFATTDREEVRAIVELPEGVTEDALPITSENIQVNSWGEMKNGQQICTGTLSIGIPKESSYLQSLELKNSNPEDLRILSEYKPGMELEPEEIYISQDMLRKQRRWLIKRQEF